MALPAAPWRRPLGRGRKERSDASSLAPGRWTCRCRPRPDRVAPRRRCRLAPVPAATPAASSYDDRSLGAPTGLIEEGRVAGQHQLAGLEPHPWLGRRVPDGTAPRPSGEFLRQVAGSRGARPRSCAGRRPFGGTRALSGVGSPGWGVPVSVTDVHPLLRSGRCPRAGTSAPWAANASAAAAISRSRLRTASARGRRSMPGSWGSAASVSRCSAAATSPATTASSITDLQNGGNLRIHSGGRFRFSSLPHLEVLMSATATVAAPARPGTEHQPRSRAGARA